MELPGHGGPTSAGDDDRLPRFPDPPPPPPKARNVVALQEEAALVRRRDELLWELHHEQIRLNMILRELVETEYAMAARFAPAAPWPAPTVPWSQERWHRSRAPSVTTWEDAPLRQPSARPEHPPSCYRNPAAVRPPPLYPHVERSPSPTAMSRYQQYCRSPSKQTRTEEALVPGVANAGVRSMGSEFPQEVTPEHKEAVAGECKAGLEEGKGVQPFSGSENQSSGQRKAAETTMVDLINESGRHSCRYKSAGQESTAFKQQKQLEFSELAPEQPWPGSETKQQQECRSSGATVHRTSGYVELCQLSSQQIRDDKTLAPVASNTRRTQSSSGEVVAENRWDIGGGPKVSVAKIGNQNSAQKKSEESAMEAHMDRPMQSPHGYMPAGQRNTAYNEQKGIELCEIWRGSAAKQQQECRSPGARELPFSGYAELCQSPNKQTPVEILVPAAANGSTQLTRSVSLCHEVASGPPQAVGGEPKVDVASDHGAQPLDEIKNQSSEQRKIEEPAMEGQINKPLESFRYNKQKRIDFSEAVGGEPKVDVACGHGAQPLHEIKNQSSGQRKVEEPVIESQIDKPHTVKRIEFSEPTPERASSGVKRRFTEAMPPVKKPKPIECQVNPTSQSNLDEHLVGQLHQSNVEAPQARSKPAEINTKAAPDQRNIVNLKDGESLRRDGKENLAENTGSRHQVEKPHVKSDLRQPVKDRLEPAPMRWTCSICQAKCTSESDYYEHLRGRRHRENTEALRAEFRSQSERRDEDAGMTADWNRKRAFYCHVCNVQCNSEKMLASHLGGRRHREALETLEAEWRK